MMEMHTRVVTNAHVVDTVLQAQYHLCHFVSDDGFHIKDLLKGENGVHRAALDFVYVIRRRTEARVRHAEGIIELWTLRIFAADMVEFLVVVRVVGDVNSIWSDLDYWTVLAM